MILPESIAVGNKPWILPLRLVASVDIPFNITHHIWRMTMKCRILATAVLFAGLFGSQGVAAETGRQTYKGKTVSQWLEVLKSSKKWTNEWELAASALTNIGPAAVPALIEALKDKDVGARYGAATVLGRIGPAAKSAVPVLIGALRDKDGWVRYGAATVLGRIGPAAKSAVPALIEALKDNDEKVRTGAAWALGGIGASARIAVPALIGALKGGDERTRAVAASALGRFGAAAKAAVPALIKVLKDKDARVRDEAATGLGWIGPAAVSALIDALKDKDGNVRAGAATALGLMGSAARSAETALNAMSRNDPSLVVRRAAETALDRINDGL